MTLRRRALCRATLFPTPNRLLLLAYRSLVAVAFVLCCTSGALGRSLLGSSSPVVMQAKTGEAKSVQDVYEAQVSPFASPQAYLQGNAMQAYFQYSWHSTGLSSALHEPWEQHGDVNTLIHRNVALARMPPYGSWQTSQPLPAHDLAVSLRRRSQC